MSVATVQSVATVVTVMSVLSAESAENRDGQDTCTVLYSAMHGLGPIDHPSHDTGYLDRTVATVILTNGCSM